MITLPDGTPQLDEGNLIKVGFVNGILRDWSAQRRCVNCKWFQDTEGGQCWKFYMWFKNESVHQNTHSCAAFEEEEKKP